MKDNVRRELFHKLDNNVVKLGARLKSILHAAYYYNDLFYFSHAGVKNHKCSDCDKSFMYAEGLLKHKQVHVLGTIRECSNCKQHFQSLKELREHMLVSGTKHTFLQCVGY